MAHAGTAYRAESGDVLFSIQLLLAREQDGDEAPSDRTEWDAVLAIPTLEAPGPGVQVDVRPSSEPEPEPEPEPRREAKRPAPPPHLRRLREAEPALRDPSTGAATAAALERDLKLDRGRLHGGAFALAVVDVVPLVEIRQHSGHEAAEQVLRALVEAVPFVLRGGDRIYRTGPDELALLLPGSDLTGAAAMCLRLQASVRDVLVRRELPEIMLSARPFERAA